MRATVTNYYYAQQSSSVTTRTSEQLSSYHEEKCSKPLNLKCYTTNAVFPQVSFSCSCWISPNYLLTPQECKEKEQ